MTKLYMSLIMGISFILLLSINIMIFWNTSSGKSISQATTSNAYFAGGCFWCMEGIFEAQDGVLEAVSWYIGGTQETANYKDVSTGTTAHREAVKVVYNPEIISYKTLVELYWTQIDPTNPDGQFADTWHQYTTAIYYSTLEEKDIAEASKQQLEQSWKFEKPVVTLLEPYVSFYPAESYHQDYYKKSSFRYNLYKRWSGRQDFIETNWKDRILELTEQTYSDEELRKRLTPLQYKVTQEAGTEKPFENEYWDNKEAGIYVDVIDGTPLYSSLDKFDSGTGWPSFTKSISEEVIKTQDDTKFFMQRTEAISASSDAHLGHIFPDGPQELGGIRHCINSAALRFIPLDEMQDQWYGEYLDLFQK